MLLLFFCGLACFLAGMQIMKLGFEKISLSKIKNILLRFTSSPVRGALTGAVITSIIQSSSAVTVIAIGLVNVGAMTFPQTIGIILGTNVGTTVTAQIITLDITKWSPFFVGVGISLIPLKKSKLRFIGQAFLGFGLIFLGLKWMTLAVEPLKYLPVTKKFLASGNNNLLLTMLISTSLTALFQSSSTIIGMTLALAAQGLIELQGAVAVVLGSNIGTCITAILAAAGGSPAARRVAMAHVLLNMAGAIIFFPIIEPFSYLISLTSSNLPRQIANAHTIYNIISSLAILPFSNWYAHVVEFICRE
ncbi:MAG: phosphate:Na+ symporter [Clostridia bacterium]|nr:Na/Pi-cotransporter II-related protein [Clostridiales bacterium]MDK2985165.1 phosphate:Na+ symporter [Clostridia bacterium]